MRMAAGTVHGFIKVKPQARQQLQSDVSPIANLSENSGLIDFPRTDRPFVKGSGKRAPTAGAVTTRSQADVSVKGL